MHNNSSATGTRYLSQTYHYSYVFSLFFLYLLLSISCNSPSQKNAQRKADSVEAAIREQRYVDSLMNLYQELPAATDTFTEYYDPEEVARNLAKQTELEKLAREREEYLTLLQEEQMWLQYPEYAIYFPHFKGYEKDVANVNGSWEYSTPTPFTASDERPKEADLLMEQVNDSVREKIQVYKDTLHLSEDVGVYLDNTRMHIIPSDRHDRFVVSYCMLTRLNETSTDRDFPGGSSWQEYTPFIRLRDSVRNQFVIDAPDDRVLYGQPGPKEDDYFARQLAAIKRKYRLQDTLIEISGEGGSSYITLKKGKKLYGYGRESYLIRVEQYRNGRLRSRKFIVIYMSFGC